MKRILCVAAVLFMSACASPRIVRIGPPGEISEENSFAGQDLYLTRFAVKNKASKDTRQSEDRLRAQLIEYIKHLGRFRSVRDATPGRGVAPPPAALTFDVDLQITQNDDNVSMGKVTYGLYVLYAITPRKGNLSVSGNGVLRRDGRTLSSKSWTSAGEYSYFFFGFFRTGPIQEAFRAAYEDVFNHIAVPLKIEGGPGVSRDELQNMVKESVQKATQKEEAVYHSDIDEPGYKAAENPDYYALVIGIEKYSAVPPADFAERDAQAVKDHLLALGYPQRNIVHLAGSLASRANIEKYIESWLPGKVGENSRVFVYFSGHGAPDVGSQEAYLVPWDGDVKFLRNTGYPLKRLYGKLNELKAKQVIVALDSCFSGAGGRSVLPKGTRPLIAKLDDGSSSLGRLAVVAASAGDEISGSAETQGHGLFTYYFLKGLNEKKGVATLKGLYDYLLPLVQDATRQSNRDQTPQLLGAGSAGVQLSLGQ